MTKRVLRVVLAGLLLGAVLGACGDDDDGGTGSASGAGSGSGEESKASAVTIKTREYNFQLPGTSFKGGLVELTLDNSAGKESHEVDLSRLDDGKTLADVQAAANTDGPPPAWLHAAGGPGPVSPGETAVYTANLEPGTYVLQCHIPAPDGEEHSAKGMISEVKVTEGETGDLPEADLTIGADEFKFTGVDGLKKGDQTVKFENTGEQQHHAAILTLAPGKKVADVLAFFSATTPPAGPPPFVGIPGFMSTFGPGQEAVRTQSLEPGTYAILCFIPDKDGVPHAAKGMAQEFTIS